MYEVFIILNVYVIVFFYSEYMYNWSIYSYLDNKNFFFFRLVMCFKGLFYLFVIIIILIFGIFILFYILVVFKKDVNVYFLYIR